MADVRRHRAGGTTCGLDLPIMGNPIVDVRPATGATARDFAMDGHTHHHPREATGLGGAHTVATVDSGMAASPGLDRLALSATLHCLTGCGIGEVLGMVVGTALGWGSLPTVALAVALAFAFGYALTLLPLLRAGLGLRAALGLALAADTASITVMEVVDNAVMLAVPGAMDAGLAEPLFWASLAVALAVAAAAAFPVNRWLIARGRGHVVVHARHGRHH